MAMVAVVGLASCTAATDSGQAPPDRATIPSSSEPALVEISPHPRLDELGSADNLEAPGDGQAGRELIWPSQLVADCERGEPFCETPWDQAWADDREAVVNRIIENGWGIDGDNILQGPGGLRIDLDDCPADWDPKAGLTDEQIRLAMVAPLSGNLAVVGPGHYVESYLETVNDLGGVDGRSLHFEQRDDSYSVDLAVQQVKELVEDGGWFTVSTVGSLAMTGAADALSRSCVPHLLPMTGWTVDPNANPFTIPGQLGFAAEAELWIRYIADSWNEDEPPTIAAVVMDNELGNTYLAAAAAAVDRDLPGAELITVSHSPMAYELTADVQELLDAEPDVWISMTAGNPCLLAVTEVGKSARAPDIRFTPSVCTDPNAFLFPADDDGEGWLSIDTGPEFLAELPGGPGTFHDALDNQMSDRRWDSSVRVWLPGWHWAWHATELLRIAAELPGGLTRPNLLLAGWSADLRPPFNFPATPFRLDGPADPSPIATATVSRWVPQESQWQPIDSVSTE